MTDGCCKKKEKIKCEKPKQSKDKKLITLIQLNLMCETKKKRKKKPKVAM